MMKFKKNHKLSILFLLVFGTAAAAGAQQKNIWLTYSQSVFVYSPGIEANYFFNERLGIQAGVNSFIHLYNPNQVANVYYRHTFNIYNANVGLSSYVYQQKSQKFGATLGFKAYYGPNYKLLSYYNKGGYYIYYDSTLWKPDFGLDMGIFYVEKWFTALLKFDTAQKKIRFGVGYSF